MSLKSTLIHLLLLAPLAFAAPSPAKKRDTPDEASKEAADNKGSDDTAAGEVSASSGPVSGFEFSKWNLQLPIGQPGKPETIPGSKLATYSDPEKKYYYMEGGALIMKVPEPSSGCVHTKNSKHCRTELREASPNSWSPKKARNRLHATLTVISAGGSVCVGQIHIDDKISVKPVAELYYSGSGQLTFGVGQTKEGGDQIRHDLVKIPVGTKFSYTIAYEGDVLYVEIEGKRYPSSGGFSNKLGALDSYFKAGNYVQGDGASELHFFGIKTEH